MSNRRRPRATAKTGAPKARAAPTPRALVLAAPVIAFVSLFWSLRGAPLGTPVIDDWAFLARVHFQRPLDALDSMGAVFYWRPLSRQAWFSLLGPAIEAAPWIAALAALATLAALSFVLGRVARRLGATPEVATLVACVPLSCEPVRVLVGWPSGIQHLLAALFVLAAVHETLAGRRVTAAIAVLFGLLSHELAVIALVAVPLAASTRPGRPWRAAVLASLGVALAWAGGYALALRHGVALPAGAALPALARAPEALLRALFATMNLEELPPVAWPVLGLAAAALAVAAVFAMIRRRAAGMRVPASILAIAVVSVLPLTAVLPDWNAWRAFLSIVALAAAMTWWLATASPRLAWAFLALRLVALVGSTPAQGLTRDAPDGISDVSFPRLTRLQRLVSETRHTLFATHPRLPRGARVYYWGMPRYATIAFQLGLAPRVWYRDSSLAFEPFLSEKSLEPLPDAALSYDLESREPGVHSLQRPALAAYRDGLRAWSDHRSADADSCYVAALALQQPPSGMFTSKMLRIRALLALDRNDLAAAEAFVAGADSANRGNPDGLALSAVIALRKGDRAGARHFAEQCLAMDPLNGTGNAVLRDLRGTPPGRSR